MFYHKCLIYNSLSTITTRRMPFSPPSNAHFPGGMGFRRRRIRVLPAKCQSDGVESAFRRQNEHPMRSDERLGGRMTIRRTGEARFPDRMPIRRGRNRLNLAGAGFDDVERGSRHKAAGFDMREAASGRVGTGSRRWGMGARAAGVVPHAERQGHRGVMQWSAARKPFPVRITHCHHMPKGLPAEAASNAVLPSHFRKPAGTGRKDLKLMPSGVPVVA